MMFVALAALPAAVPAVDGTPATAAIIPFSIDQIFGSRPVVAATINGKPVRLVIHANAGSYLQINHAEAKAVGAHDLKHKGAFGIAAPGKVSGLGRDDGLVDRLAIRSWQAPSAAVAVFEVPAGGSQGMLGLPWLYANRVVLDFDRNVAVLSEGSAKRGPMDAAMAERGYTALRMTRDPADGRYLVTATINGVSAPMVVSTVAATDVDSGFAARAKLATGAQTGTYGGPSGATGKVFETEMPITIDIDGWASLPQKVSIEDTYAYSSTPRPTGSEKIRGGALGADFMIRYRAVVDFGNLTLYLPTRKGS